MELRKYKRIKNGLPTFEDGFVYGVNQYSPYVGKNWNPIIENLPYLYRPSISGYLTNYTPNVPTPELQLPQRANTPNSIKGAGVAAVAQGVASLASNFMENASARSANEMYGSTGSTSNSAHGVGYEHTNELDPAYSKEANSKVATGTLGGITAGASAGAAFGPLGSAIGGVVGGLSGLVGGLFGKSKQKREIAKAQAMIRNTNFSRRSSAATQGLLNDYYSKYGDTTSQQLFGYSKGKSSNLSPTNYSSVKKVDTSDGLKNDIQNAWGEIGEGMYNKETGSAHMIKRGPNDSAPINVKENDIIFGNEINPETGNTFKQDASLFIIAKENLNKKAPKTKGWLSEDTQKLYEQEYKKLADPLDEKLQDLADIQKQVHEMKNYYKSTTTKYPRFAEGMEWYTNAIPHLFGTIASARQYINAARNKVSMPNTFIENPYLRSSLQELKKLRINPYPIINQLQNQRILSDYSIMGSGELSNAQKNIMRLLNASNNYNATAKALADIQAQNNQYISAANSAALQAGLAEAQRRQEAKRYDLDVFEKRQGAKYQQKQMAQRNFLDYILSFYANEFKRRQGNAMFDLYTQDIANKKEALNAYINSTNRDSNYATNYVNSFGFFPPYINQNTSRFRVKPYSQWLID